MRAVRVLFASFLGYVCVEGIVFHSGLYAYYLRPDTFAGILETFLYNERARPLDGPNQVLAIGNSRMALFPRLANELKTGYTFGTIAVAGSTPRCWYYMLRDVDPGADRYSAVVIGLDNYNDDEVLEDHADRDLDSRLLSARLGLRDVVEYASSFRSWEHRWPAIRSILFKGTIWNLDVQDFLEHPAARRAYVKLSWRNSHSWFYDYVGTSSTMEGVHIDWAAHTMTVPPDRTAAQKRAYEVVLSDPIPVDLGRHSQYLHHWLEKTYERYRGSRTRLIFLRLPRGPLVRPDFPPTKPASSVRELASKPGVTLLGEHTFDSLEQPTLFSDEDHMNGPGFEQFSRMAAREVARVLGPPR